MKSKAATMSEASKRKARYASLASEVDKASRNSALEKAMGEGAANVKGMREVSVEVKDEKTGETRIETQVVKVAEPVEVALPQSNSRSAKRARLKSSRHKVVKDVRHPVIPCGNVGCRTCSPVARLAYANMHERKTRKEAPKKETAAVQKPTAPVA